MLLRTYVGILICLLLIPVGTVAIADEPPIDPSKYPAMSEKQIGHLRHIVELANLLHGDWTQMGDTPPGSNFGSYQYQIGFMAYALGVTQYHLTPAYREIYQQASNRLIEKMLHKDVWDYWERMSKKEVLFAVDGTRKEYSEPDWLGWRDPNIKSNIMYSGHLLQMVSLYEMLFDDRRYDRPGSLSFSFSPIEYGADPTIVEYDHQKLVEVIYDQFGEDDYRGIECERGAVYTECNQHPILGLIQYDQKHETDFAADVTRGFEQTILDRGYISPVTHTNMYYLDVRQDEVVPATWAWSDGWNGHAHHVWAKSYTEANYQDQVKLYVPSMFRGEPGSDMGWTVSFDFGWFALLASEVGDTKTVEAMLEYADRHFNPVWKNGAYFYPHTPDYRSDHLRDSQGFIRNVNPLTGNALIGFARLNPPDGLWELYNHPWEEQHFAAPFISDVEYLEASVSQAIYDDARDALIVTLVPGPVEAASTTFTINQLDPSKDYAIFKDGELLGKVRVGDAGTQETRWNRDGSLTLSTTLAKPHSLVIASTAGAAVARNN